MSPDGSLIPIKDLPEEVARVVSSYKVTEFFDKDGNRTAKHEYRFWDKGRSLERLSRHLGLYNDSITVKLEDGLKAIMAVLPEEIREQAMAKILEVSKAKK